MGRLVLLGCHRGQPVHLLATLEAGLLQQSQATVHASVCCAGEGLFE